ncbi:MAG: amidohydrolase [Erysipelotrichaceae bacterium]
MLLIKNGTVHTMCAETPVCLDILVEDGKIKEMGKSLSYDCETIDACGNDVYPGIIEAHCHLGISESSIRWEGEDCNEHSDPITPEVRVIDGINMMDETVANANAAGITTVCCAPGSANVMGGQVNIYKTYGISVDEATINPYYAMKCAFGENPKGCYRDNKIKTRMGTAAYFRKTMFAAQQYLAQKEAAKEDATKLPKYDMQMEALIPVLKKEVLIKAHAHRADDILTCIRLAQEFDLEMTLDHCTEGHIIPEYVKASGYPAIVGPSLTHKTKFELKNKTFETPAILHKAGVLLALTTDSPVIPQEYLPLCASLAVKSGLPEFEALKAITINAAKIIKQDQRLGTLEVGKDADIVICDKSILDVSHEVLYTITDGRITFQK